MGFEVTPCPSIRLFGCDADSSEAHPKILRGARRRASRGRGQTTRGRPAVRPVGPTHRFRTSNAQSGGRHAGGRLVRLPINRSRRGVAQHNEEAITRTTRVRGLCASPWAGMSSWVAKTSSKAPHPTHESIHLCFQFFFHCGACFLPLSLLALLLVFTVSLLFGRFLVLGLIVEGVPRRPQSLFLDLLVPPPPRIQPLSYPFSVPDGKTQKKRTTCKLSP